MKRILISIFLSALYLSFMGCGAHCRTHPPNKNPTTIVNFIPTDKDKTNLCMAYLSYIGEELVNAPRETNKILARINKTIPKIEQLSPDGNSDWKVVWGPAIYTFPIAIFQDNGMFVAQQISNPKNYIVAIRGTNFIAALDWMFEDFNVLFLHDWPAGRGSPKISAATHEGVKVLNDYLKPKSEKAGEKLPGEGLTLKRFLTVAAKNTKINVSFTGHSLGGALAPTLALLFKQEQGQAGGWDSQNNATVTSTSFAGATAGNADFATYSDQEIGSVMRRIHDLNDVVPHAWNKNTMEQTKDLYLSSGIKMGKVTTLALDTTIEFTKDKCYTQINQSLPFTFSVAKSNGDSYIKQMSYQHTHSYPLFILGHDQGTNLITLVNAKK